MSCTENSRTSVSGNAWKNQREDTEDSRMEYYMTLSRTSTIMIPTGPQDPTVNLTQSF